MQSMFIKHLLKQSHESELECKSAARFAAQMILKFEFEPPIGSNTFVSQRDPEWDPQNFHPVHGPLSNFDFDVEKQHDVDTSLRRNVDPQQLQILRQKTRNQTLPSLLPV